MIDWKVITGSQCNQEKGWAFPNFEIQEYLLPILNVGFAFIDPYGDTTFQRDDCLRMKGNIAYMLHSGILTQKQEIQYDCFEKGLVTLTCEEIVECLERLRDGLDRTLTDGGTLVFYGD